MGLKQTRVSLVISRLKYVKIKINYFRCSAVINFCVEITICMHACSNVSCNNQGNKNTVVLDGMHLPLLMPDTTG